MYIRENISYIVDAPVDDVTTTAAVMTSTDAMTVVMTSDSLTTEDTLDAASNDSVVEGLCHNVPASIHVHIQYAKAGELNGTDINDIVGAKVRSVLPACDVSCARDAAACLPASTGTCLWHTMSSQYLSTVIGPNGGLL